MYASRLRPRRLARSPQSLKVRGPGGAHARREISWGGTFLCAAFYSGLAGFCWVRLCLLAGEPVDGYGAMSIEETPSTRRRTCFLFFAEIGRPGRPGAVSIRNDTWLALDDDDDYSFPGEGLNGGAGLRMKRGSRRVVKGDVGAW